MTLPRPSRLPLQEESTFFLERKNQRTLPSRTPQPPSHPNPMCKVFLLLFLQKKETPAFLPGIIPA